MRPFVNHDQPSAMVVDHSEPSSPVAIIDLDLSDHHWIWCYPSWITIHYDNRSSTVITLDLWHGIGVDKGFQPAIYQASSLAICVTCLLWDFLPLGLEMHPVMVVGASKPDGKEQKKRPSTHQGSNSHHSCRWCNLVIRNPLLVMWDSPPLRACSQVLLHKWSII